MQSSCIACPWGKPAPVVGSGQRSASWRVDAWFQEALLWLEATGRSRPSPGSRNSKSQLWAGEVALRL